MSDIIFKTDGKETLRIPFPTPGTKCPEMKLEIKMTSNKEIEKVKAEIKVLEKKLSLLEEIEKQPRMEFGYDGKFEIVSYNDKVYYRLEFPDEVYWYRRKDDDNAVTFLKQITDGETHRLLEGLWFNEVKKGVIDEPEHYDEVEWDEKDNSKPMDEVMDRLVKKYQAQKLYKRLFEVGYGSEDCEMILSVVEEWLPKEQSAAGSQNVNTELLVDGFNDCVRKMKEMLR